MTFSSFFLGCLSKEYLIQRIIELSDGPYLQRFIWNGGGKWRGKEWTPELPTDAQILIHLFCTFLDLKLPTTTTSVSFFLFISFIFSQQSQAKTLVLCAFTGFQLKINNFRI